MFNYLGNNLFILWGTYPLAIILWFLARRINKTKIRRITQISIIVLSIPLFYFGHPFMYIPAWALLIASIYEGAFQTSVVMLIVWSIIVSVSLFLIKQNEKT